MKIIGIAQALYELQFDLESQLLLFLGLDGYYNWMDRMLINGLVILNYNLQSRLEAVQLNGYQKQKRTT